MRQKKRLQNNVPNAFLQSFYIRFYVGRNARWFSFAGGRKYALLYSDLKCAYLFYSFIIAD